MPLIGPLLAGLAGGAALKTGLGAKLLGIENPGLLAKTIAKNVGQGKILGNLVNDKWNSRLTRGILGASAGYATYKIGHSEFLSDTMYGYYGYNDRVGRNVSQLQNLSTVGAGAMALGIYGASPIANYIKGKFKGGAGISSEISDAFSPVDLTKAKATWNPPGTNYSGSLSKWKGRMPSFKAHIRRYPILAPAVYGGIIGGSLGAGLAVGGNYGAAYRGISSEGNIVGIDNGQGGGISPELQFSTQGLILNIHNRRKRRVM
jgi:hypothetical protein